MAEYLRVKNWETFQHYKDRSPPWIKLHRELLRDYQFSCLQDASKLHLMLIWLLASQLDNRIPADPAWIQKQIGVADRVDLKPLIDAGFLLPEQNASNTLASCKQSAMPETEAYKEAKEAPVGALTSQQQKDEFWKIGLPLLTSQGMEEKKARTFLGKAISQAGPAEGLAIMRLARESGDAVAYIAKCAVVPKLPTDNHELWELRAKLGLERYYEDVDSAHAEIRQRLREQPELRAAL